MLLSLFLRIRFWLLASLVACMAGGARVLLLNNLELGAGSALLAIVSSIISILKEKKRGSETTFKMAGTFESVISRLEDLFSRENYLAELEDNEWMVLSFINWVRVALIIRRSKGCR